MYQENIIDMLMRKMIHFNQNDPQRIHHLIKVHSFAQMIGRMEQLDGHSQFLTECAAFSACGRPCAKKYQCRNSHRHHRQGYSRPRICRLRPSFRPIER